MSIDFPPKPNQKLFDSLHHTQMQKLCNTSCDAIACRLHVMHTASEVVFGGGIKNSGYDEASTEYFTSIGFSGSGTREEFRPELEIFESLGDFRYSFSPRIQWRCKIRFRKGKGDERAPSEKISSRSWPTCHADKNFDTANAFEVKGALYPHRSFGRVGLARFMSTDS